MTTSLLAAAPDLMVLAAISALILLAMVTLRNPLLPAWLQNEGIASALGLFLTAGILATVVDAVPKLSAADIPYSLIAAVIAGVIAGSIFVLWKVFDVGGRLARAEAGHAPVARAPLPLVVGPEAPVPPVP
ncbi:MAG: hypothetical protein P8Z80_06165 [Pseudolabrys sp.]